MIRFDVVADGEKPLVVQFEPAANELVIAPGDRILIEWPDWDGRAIGSFYWGPDRLIIAEPSFALGSGWPRVWDSNGEEITY